MPDKPSEFYTRTDPRERLGFRVWRLHTARNMKKDAWLREAIREKCEREEMEFGQPPGPPPYRPTTEVF